MAHLIVGSWITDLLWGMGIAIFEVIWDVLEADEAASTRSKALEGRIKQTSFMKTLDLPIPLNCSHVPINC